MDEHSNTVQCVSTHPQIFHCPEIYSKEGGIPLLFLVLLTNAPEATQAPHRCMETHLMDRQARSIQGPAEPEHIRHCGAVACPKIDTAGCVIDSEV